MKSGPQPEHKSKMPKLDIILAFALLVVVIAAASWYAAYHKPAPKTASSSAPAGWSHYTSNKYGFRFDYPGSWGNPQVSVTPGKTGSHYQITFSKDPTSVAPKKLNVSIGMDSIDYTTSACPSGCTPLIDKTIQDHLKTGAQSLMKHDDSSYAFLSVIGQTSTLMDVQIVSLPKVSVTGAMGSYTLNGTTTCPAGKLSPSAKSGCISTGDYNTLNTAMKSLKGL